MTQVAPIMSKRIRRKVNHPEVDHGLLPGLLGYNLRRAQTAVYQSFQSAIAPYDISPGQFGVLVLISENPGLSQSELGNAMGIDRSTMVAVIDRLESRNYVVRTPSPYDRRSYALQLSEEGQKVIKKIVPMIQDHEAAISKDLSKAELSQLIESLGKIAMNAR